MSVAPTDRMPDRAAEARHFRTLGLKLTHNHSNGAPAAALTMHSAQARRRAALTHGFVRLPLVCRRTEP